ncbi:hypothetical protein BDR03DRAFT_688423 [Suillus americanus]|nr:hypothetical protein BDR03DRAFT_688423 [Suillus americanus]
MAGTYPLGQPFFQDHKTLYCASFSRDRRCVAYGGDENSRTFTLWMVKVVPIPQESDREVVQEETVPSPCHCLASMVIPREAMASSSMVTKNYTTTSSRYLLNWHHLIPISFICPQLAASGTSYFDTARW